jgi:peptide deformylase
MTVISILQYPDPRLHTKARSVKNVADKEIQKIIDDMLETLLNTSNCAGLSATQLDIADPPRITVIYDDNNKALCLINPEVIAKGDETITSDEGCMSIYPNNIHAPVKRAKTVTVKALNRDGQSVKIEANGFLAKCLQHEIDHLDGVIYLDYLSPLEQSRINEKINQVRNKKTNNLLKTLLGFKP